MGLKKIMLAQLLMCVLVIFSVFGLSGCAPAFVATGAATTAYVASKDVKPTQQAKDLKIQAVIADKLLQINLDYVKDVEISVVDSEVLLLGIVSSPKEKRKIYDITASTEGVKKVYNKLIVDNKYSAKNYLNDSLIANAIRARMIASEHTYLTKINVEVFNNVVYVFGIVGNDEEKYYAEQIARTGKGVLSVFSFVRVNRSK